MENNTEQKLVKLISDINLLYLESKEKQSLQKKLENYQNANVLITEAKNLLENLQYEINNLDMAHIDKSQTSNAQKYIELLSAPHLNFKELFYIVKQLKQISMGVPATANINDHMENEAIIYEEQEIEEQ